MELHSPSWPLFIHPYSKNKFLLIELYSKASDYCAFSECPTFAKNFKQNALSYLVLGLPRWRNGKESTCNAGEKSSIPGSGRSSGKGNGNLLQYSCLGNPMDRDCWAIVNEVAKESDTAL